MTRAVAGGAVQAAPVDDTLGTVEAFLAGWRPYAELPQRHPLRRDIPAVLGAGSRSAREARFARANSLYALQCRYRELGVLREPPGERARQFEALLDLSLAALARAIEAGDAREHLRLLQYTFEFGRHPVPAQQTVVRGFLLELLGLEVRAPAMKYSLYPNGVLYTGGGKTHEEMAREFVTAGYGGGLPAGGGLLWRTDTLAYTFDLSSTAFGTPADVATVAKALKRAIRQTGGDEARFAFTPDRRRTPA